MTFREHRPAPRGINLAAQAAARWMTGFGWSTRGSTAGLRVFGNVLDDEDFTIARVWHTARRVDRRSERWGVAVVLVVEGTLSVRSDGFHAILSEGQGLVHRTSSALSVESEQPHGTVEVLLGNDYLDRYWNDVPERPVVLGTDLASSRVLLATTMSTLSSTVKPGDDHWQPLRAAVENVVDALLIETGPQLGSSAPADSARVVRRAMSVIRDRASESSFDVDALAAELSLSRSALYAAFARTGRTPARAIRAARTAEARAMLARRPSPSSSDLSDVARLSGLGTSRRLRAALDSEARSSGAGN